MLSPSFISASPFTGGSGRSFGLALGTDIATHSSHLTRHSEASRATVITSKLYGQRNYSRRFFAFRMIPIYFIATRRPAANAAAPRRTILDEEKERRGQLIRKDEEDRTKALIAAFEAVNKACEQLGDVEAFVKDNDWKAIRRFSRLFNNSVEREGMEPLTRQLTTKSQRKDSFELCQKLTESLKEMDQSAKREDGEAVLAALGNSRQIIAAFQEFKP